MKRKLTGNELETVDSNNDMPGDNSQESKIRKLSKRLKMGRFSKYLFIAGLATIALFQNCQRPVFVKMPKSAAIIPPDVVPLPDVISTSDTKVINLPVNSVENPAKMTAIIDNSDGFVYYQNEMVKYIDILNTAFSGLNLQIDMLSLTASISMGTKEGPIVYERTDNGQVFSMSTVNYTPSFDYTMAKTTMQSAEISRFKTRTPASVSAQNSGAVISDDRGVSIKDYLAAKKPSARGTNDKESPLAKLMSQVLPETFKEEDLKQVKGGDRTTFLIITDEDDQSSLAPINKRRAYSPYFNALATLSKIYIKYQPNKIFGRTISISDTGWAALVVGEEDIKSDGVVYRGVISAYVASPLGLFSAEQLSNPVEGTDCISGAFPRANDIRKSEILNKKTSVGFKVKSCQLIRANYSLVQSYTEFRNNFPESVVSFFQEEPRFPISVQASPTSVTKLTRDFPSIILSYDNIYYADYNSLPNSIKDHGLTFKVVANGYTEHNYEQVKTEWDFHPLIYEFQKNNYPSYDLNQLILPDGASSNSAYNKSDTEDFYYKFIKFLLEKKYGVDGYHIVMGLIDGNVCKPGATQSVGTNLMRFAKVIGTNNSTVAPLCNLSSAKSIIEESAKRSLSFSAKYITLPADTQYQDITQLKIMRSNGSSAAIGLKSGSATPFIYNKDYHRLEFDDGFLDLKDTVQLTVKIVKKQ